MKRAALWLAALAIAGCASAPPRPAEPVVPAAPVSPAAPAGQTLPNDLKWVRDAAEYQALVLQTFRAATDRVEQQARARAAGTWAVVADADETVISNFQYQMERARQGLGFTTDSWNAWTKRREAVPLPGAAVFLARVRQLGGRIAIVTNRLGSECADTEAVFRAHQLAYDVILCRPDGTPSDKNPRFASVASGQAFGTASPLEVVAVLGDNILDFPRLTQSNRAFTEFGVRYFMLPNPMYGSWQ